MCVIGGLLLWGVEWDDGGGVGVGVRWIWVVCVM